MKKLNLILFFVVLLSAVIHIVHATPVLFGPIPADGSYVAGGYVDFYVNISDEAALDTSSVRLHIKAEGQQLWDVHQMNCTYKSGIDWYCNFTKSLAIAGSDTLELFYFDAIDTDGHGYLGTEDASMTFTLDLNPPDISFEDPKNETYVSGVENIILTVFDISSGTDKPSVKYSFDNSTWLSMTCNGHCTASWDTTGLENKKNVTIYAKASDVLGNEARKKINVTVDNEIPSIFILDPTEQKVSGIILLKVNVSDIYSGINTSSAKYAVDGAENTISCSGTIHSYTCENYFNTKYISDGLHTINFSVRDNAGNFNSTNTQVTVDNGILSVSINNPANNAYVKGVTSVNATLVNPQKAEGAKIKINNTWYSMTCVVSACSYSWNTATLADGAQILFVNTTNNVTYLANASISVTVDNTKPQLFVESPTTGKVNGTIYPKVVITDNYGVVEPKSFFSISVFSSGMACSREEGGKKYTCSGNFDTTTLIDGNYTLYFFGEDLAGNQNSTSIVLNVKNGITNVTNTTTTTTLQNATTTTIAATTTTTPTTLGWGESTLSIIEILKETFNEIKKPTNLVIILVVVGLAIFGIWLLKKILSKPKLEVPK